MAERFERLNRYLRGWMNYFGISQHYTSIEELDGWLRRQIRMCYWKQISASAQLSRDANREPALRTCSSLRQESVTRF
ncbi:group II intron maturase-specific domain-containing protein [Leptolyngbya sp. NK1-12]|uniref:group II intron maturase-specific domain-containing protein n=1 Tax=Leptolyngbya sp. NK1-12 TaxID=2547451 RepID=UPI003B63A54A